MQAKHTEDFEIVTVANWYISYSVMMLHDAGQWINFIRVCRILLLVRHW